MRRLDIGIASFGRNHQQLRRTLTSLRQNSVTDWRCFVIHNPSAGDELTVETIAGFAAEDKRFVPLWCTANMGYAGAINILFDHAETEYIAYSDNDTYIMTEGWDETLCSYLDRFHEIGMIFPGGGPYPIDRGAYTEVQWGVGFCWILNRLCAKEVGPFDAEIGHQNECDYALRVRMAGWKCAAASEVYVKHEATASNDPASVERINAGVRDFVNKWCRYFGGKNLNYHSTNVLRWEDWPPNALYMEEWWKLQAPAKIVDRQPDNSSGSYEAFPTLNALAEVISYQGRDYDLIRVPRFKGFYRGRII